MQQREEEYEIHGDVLETILTHVPLIHLVSASGVCKWWCTAVSSSLRHCNPPKPWLILHTQSRCLPYATTSRAYDPRSNIWVNISQPSMKYFAALRSSDSNFLYMLSPSKFAFSLDQLGYAWCTVNPPLVWRADPIVARVGDSVIVAGGACYFEEDPLAVEIYDLRTREWCMCESMPASLKDSAASPWLSIAATSEKLFVADKQSGLTHAFDPITKSWSEPFVLNPGEPVSSYHIGSSDCGLIFVGVCKTNEDLGTVKIWRIIGDDFDLEEIGEMPREFVTKLKGRSFGISSSIDIRVAGKIVYVYNTWEAEEVVACELEITGSGCGWWSLRNSVAGEGMVAERLVFSCSEIGIEELQRAMVVKNWRFEVSSGDLTRPCEAVVNC